MRGERVVLRVLDDRHVRLVVDLIYDDDFGWSTVHLLVSSTKELEPPLDVVRVDEEDSLVRLERARFRIVQTLIVRLVPVLVLEPQFLADEVEDPLPNALRPFAPSHPLPLALGIEEERPRPPRVRLPLQLPQQLLAPLEPLGELPLDLVDAIEELLEDGTRLLERVTRAGELFLHRREERRLRTDVVAWDSDERRLVAAEVSRSIREAVAVRDPVFLDEDGETLGGAVVGVEAELGEGGQLGGAVPAVGTMDEDVRVGEVDRARDDEDAVEDVGEVLEPLRALKSGAIEVACRFRVAKSFARGVSRVQ
mgnify:FL=1